MSDGTDNGVADLRVKLAKLEDRLSQTTKRNKELLAQLSEAQQLVTERDGAIADHTKQAKAWESTQAELERYKGLESRWATERQIVAAGITDPEGVDLAVMAWERLETKPEGGPAAWLTGDGAPKWTTAYMTAPKPKQEGKQEEEQQQPGRWNPNAGAAGVRTSTSAKPPVVGRPPNGLSEYQAERAARFEAIGQPVPSYPW